MPPGTYGLRQSPDLVSACIVSLQWTQHSSRVHHYKQSPPVNLLARITDSSLTLAPPPPGYHTLPIRVGGMAATSAFARQSSDGTELNRENALYSSVETFSWNVKIDATEAATPLGKRGCVRVCWGGVGGSHSASGLPWTGLPWTGVPWLGGGYG